jgi:hypothetical protein
VFNYQWAWKGLELMPFERPTLAELRARRKADVAAAVPGADPLLPVSNLGILADILAEGFNGQYGYLDWIARQAVPFTATDEAFEGWAALKGVTRKPATKATGVGHLDGTSGDACLPAGTPSPAATASAYVHGRGDRGGGGTVTRRSRRRWRAPPARWRRRRDW